MLYCGIYKIENIITGDIYIGQSVNLKNRKRQHYQELRKDSHQNKHLQSSFNKYGEENFIFKTILYCEPEELTYYEQKLVDLLNPKYNKCKLCVNSTRGLKMSEEAVRINSESHKGLKLSEETKLKMSNSAKGKPKSELAKLHMRKPKSDIAKLHLSLSRESANLKLITKKEIILQIAEMLYNNICVKDICNILGIEQTIVYRTKNGFYEKYYGIKKIDNKLNRWKRPPETEE